MRALQQQIPAVAWLLVLPQLISRICHQQQEVQEVTQAIIARVAQVRDCAACSDICLGCCCSGWQCRSQAACQRMLLSDLP